ncbi:hypothetical protein AYI68_g968, partial [Smittium mucronatum]
MYSMFVTTYMIDSYEQIMVQVNSIKANTVKESENRELYERKLENSTTYAPNNNYFVDEFYIWVSYIKSLISEHEKLVKTDDSDGIKSITDEIFTVAERMLITQYNNPKAWIFLLDLITKFDKGFSEFFSVMNRASCNCPWSGEINGFLIMFDIENIDSTFDKVISNKLLNYSSIEMAIFLVSRLSTGKMLYLDGIESEKQLRKICSKSQSLMNKFSKSPDPLFRVERYIVLIEQSVFNNSGNAKNVWEQSIKLNRKNPEFWIAYANYLKIYDSIESARAVYKLALFNAVKIIKNSHQFSAEPMYIYLTKVYDEYLLSEFELGTSRYVIEANIEIENCKSKISNFLNHYYSQQGKEASYTENSHDIQQNKTNENSKRDRVINEPEDSEQPKKPKLDSSSSKTDQQITIENNELSNFKKSSKDFTVLVFPISNRVKAADLALHYSKYGKIVECKIVNETTESSTTSRHLVGHLTFERAEGVLRALLSTHSSIPSIGTVKNSFSVHVELKNVEKQWKKYSCVRRTFIIKNVPIDFDPEKIQQVIMANSENLNDDDHGNKIERSHRLISTSVCKGKKGLSRVYVTMGSITGVVEAINSLKQDLPEYSKLGMVTQEFVPSIEFNRLFNYDLNHSVYITNINYNTDANDMIEFLQTYLGTDFFVLEMKMDISGVFSGQAVVYFDSEAGPVKRIHKNIAGTKIFVDMVNNHNISRLVQEINEITLDKRNLRASLVTSDVGNNQGAFDKKQSVSDRGYSQSTRQETASQRPKQRISFAPRSVKISRGEKLDDSESADDQKSMDIEGSVPEQGRTNDDFKKIFYGN